MNIDIIKGRIKKGEDLPLIEKAFCFANSRLSGLYYSKEETLINHILEITNTLIDFKADNPTLISCILYETIKNGVSKEEIEREFGSSISNTAFLTSKINSQELILADQMQKIYLEQLNEDSPEDVRALFIRLASNFYNMQTTTNEYQKQLARETFDILIPKARIFRLNFIRSKLEDLCLLYLNPQAYNDILNSLNAHPDVLKERLDNTKKEILNLLIENNIDCIIKDRVKNIYSIYNKLMSGKKFEEIYDILALRIIVEDEFQCSKVLKLIHSNYTFLPLRVKDYIKNPKENMYQSLHTTIIDKDNNVCEIQIRTKEMNKNAEVGTASHQSYKEKTLKKVNF